MSPARLLGEEKGRIGWGCCFAVGPCAQQTGFGVPSSVLKVQLRVSAGAPQLGSGELWMLGEPRLGLGLLARNSHLLGPDVL